MANIFQDKKIIYKYNRNKDGSIALPKIFLTTRTWKRAGLIDPVFDLHIVTNFNEANTCSFTIYKKNNGIEQQIFNCVKNLSVIEIEGFGFFEIRVDTTDDNATYKKITGSSLQESELSQCNCTLEINTESDIARPEYDAAYPTVFYRNPEEAVAEGTKQKYRESSLLHRILTYAPLYSIGHVDDSLKGINREFSCSNATVYNFLQEVAEEIGCIFLFDPFARTINVYDLEDHCLSCGGRHVIDGVCQTCKDKGVIERGYGLDTSVYMDTATIAESIEDSVDTDRVKNCFKLAAGDDEITNRIGQRLIGNSNYIWTFSDDQMEEFSDDLKKKWMAYSSYVDTFQKSFDAYWDEYNEKVSDALYWQSEKMPVIETDINTSGLSNDAYYKKRCQEIYNNIADKIPYYVIGTKNAVLSSVSSNILKFANFLCPEGYKAEYQKDSKGHDRISSSTTRIDNMDVISNFECYLYVYLMDCKDENQNDKYYFESGKWTIPVKAGYKKMADDESEIFSQNYYLYLKQMIDYKMAASGISFDPKYDTDYTDGKNHSSDSDYYKNYFREYSIQRLISFRDAYDMCSTILLELDSGLAADGLQKSYRYIVYEDENKNPHVSTQTMYDKLIEKYQAFSKYINEIIIPEYTAYVDAAHARMHELSAKITEINAKCNLKNYLGEELYNELISFKREQVYQNSNFTSNVTDESLLMENIEEFILRAKEEISKSCQYQHNVPISMANLLTLADYENAFDVFALGNYIHTHINDEPVKLRIISIPFNFENIEKCEVTFSDALVGNQVMKDIQKNQLKAQSLATSFDYVQKQSTANDEKISSFSQMFSDGLDATKTMVMNADDISTVMDSHGILTRQLNLDTGEYHPEQIRITNGTIAYTDDEWSSIRTAFGKFYWNGAYRYGLIGESIVGKILAGQNLTITNGDEKNATVTIDGNGIKITKGTIAWSDKGEINAPEIEDINGLSHFKNSVNAALTGATSTEIGSDYVISPKIAAQYLYVTNGNYSVEIDPSHGSKNTLGGYLFCIRKKSDNNIILGVDTYGNSTFTGELKGVYGTFSNLSITDNSGNSRLHLDSAGILCPSLCANGDVLIQQNGNLKCSGEMTVDGNVKLGFGGSTYHDITLANAAVRGALECNGDFIAQGNVTLGTDGYIFNNVTLSHTTIEKELMVKEDSTFKKNLFITGKLVCQKEVECESICSSRDISANGTIAGNILNVANNATIAQDLAVYGSQTIGGSLSIGENIFISGNQIMFNGNINSILFDDFGIGNYWYGYSGISFAMFVPDGVGIVCPRYGDGTCALGWAGYRWSDVYAINGAIQTSDKKDKKEMQEIEPDIATQIVKTTKPVSFLWRENQSGRTHYGFSAQDFEHAVNSLGISTDHFAPITKTPLMEQAEVLDENGNSKLTQKETGEYSYGIRYTELIPILWKAVQELMSNNEQLDKEIQQLKSVIFKRES